MIRIYPEYTDCTICGSDRIREQTKKVREKFRMCKYESAVKFAHTPESVFAADSQKQNMVLLKLNRGGFVSFISFGYGLTIHAS